MRRDQLEHAIRTACQIIDMPEIIVVGSQAILGTYREDELPAAATMSIETDVLPIAVTNEETARLADQIEGVAGEFSPRPQDNSEIRRRATHRRAVDARRHPPAFRPVRSASHRRDRGNRGRQ
jgi:hypothetical protein